MVGHRLFPIIFNNWSLEGLFIDLACCRGNRYDVISALKVLPNNRVAKIFIVCLHYEISFFGICHRFTNTIAIKKTLSSLLKGTGLNVLDKGYNRVFSHDIKTAMSVSLNKETAAMLVFLTNLPGIEICSYANVFFCFSWKTILLIMCLRENTPTKILNYKKILTTNNWITQMRIGDFHLTPSLPCWCT